MINYILIQRIMQNTIEDRSSHIFTLKFNQLHIKVTICLIMSPLLVSFQVSNSTTYQFSTNELQDDQSKRLP